MIDATFVQKILDISQVQIQTIEGRPMASRQMFEIEKPLVKPLQVAGLQGLVDYVKHEVDRFDKTELMVHVESAISVKLISSFDAMYFKRQVYLQAVPKMGRMSLNTFRSQEEFILDLSTSFVRDETVEKLLQIVSNIKSEDVRLDEDDGVSQQVTSRAGVARLTNVTLPNPVTLSPYRTFAEVEQPEDLFIFRVRKGRDGDGPGFGLFENGSGRWELIAIDLIKKWIIERLPEIAVIG